MASRTLRHDASKSLMFWTLQPPIISHRTVLQETLVTMTAFFPLSQRLRGRTRKVLVQKKNCPDNQEAGKRRRSGILFLWFHWGSFLAIVRNKRGTETPFCLLQKVSSGLGTKAWYFCKEVNKSDVLDPMSTYPSNHPAK